MEQRAAVGQTMSSSLLGKKHTLEFQTPTETLLKNLPAVSTFPSPKTESSSAKSMSPRNKRGRQDESAAKLLLLSMTADPTKTPIKEPESFTTPQTSVPTKEKQHSPQARDEFVTIEMRKKERRRGQCRDQDTPQYTSSQTIRISSSLNAQQAKALAMAIQACGIASPKNLKDIKHSKVRAAALLTEEQKKARRREQCRISQATYRKRKRERNEVKFRGDMNLLQQEIQRLDAYKTRIKQHHQDPIEAIGNFYYALGIDVEKLQLPDVKNYQRIYGCSPALQLLTDLQREEFDSFESLKLHWMWYRTQFRIFQFSITSYERLEAGEHVIIKVKGELRLNVYSDTMIQGHHSGYHTIVCPVLQQFEFETGEQVIRRITSEVDLIRGIGGSHDQIDPERTLSALHCLSEDFRISNRNHV